MKLNKGYWHTVEIELKSNPDYMDVVQDYLKKNDLKDLPVPEGVPGEPEAGFVYIKKTDVRKNEKFLSKVKTDVYADSIVRVLKEGGHLAPVKVVASGPQEDSPPKMEATTPTKKIKLPKIGE